MNIFFHLNDNLIELAGLKDAATDAYVNNATVEVTAIKKIVNRAEIDVDGQTLPLAMDYVTDSDGIYQGIIEKDLEVEVGDKLAIEITVTASDDREAFFKLPVTVRQRGKSY